MSIRETIARKPGISAVLVAVIIAGALGAIALQIRDIRSASGNLAYFSADDGQSFFVDDQTRPSPFDYHGKPAYLAHVYRVGGKPVVGYLSRFSDDAIRELKIAADARSAGKPVPNGSRLSQISFNGIEIKRPGEKEWVRQGGDPKKSFSTRPFFFPDGSAPEEVFP